MDWPLVRGFALSSFGAASSADAEFERSVMVGAPEKIQQ
jgi:hypothetical protein